MCPTILPLTLLCLLGTEPALEVPSNRLCTGWSVISVRCLSPDGKFMATSHVFNKSFSIWDVATGKELLRGKEASHVTAFAFSADGKSVVTGGADKLVKVWSLATGKTTRTLEGHDNALRRLAFLPDGKALVSSDEAGQARIWDLATGKLRIKLEARSRIDALGPTPDGKTLVTADNDGKVKTWDVATGKELASFAGHKHYVRTAALSPDAKLALTAGKDGAFDKTTETVRVWDVATGKVLANLSVSASAISFADFSPDGKLLSTTDERGTNYLWDVATWKRLGALPVKGHLFVLPGAKKAVLCDSRMGVWDLAARTERGVIRAHKGEAHAVRFSPDGQTVATAGQDGFVRLWDARTGGERHKLSGHSDPVTSLGYSPDGKTLASCGKDRTVRLWDADTGKEKAVLKGSEEGLTAVAFSPDGKSLAVRGDSQSVGLWDVETAKARFTLRTERFLSGVGLGFAADGKTFAGCGKGGEVKVWDAGTGKVIRKFANTSGIAVCAFSADGKVLVAGDSDGLRCFDGASGKVLATMKQPGGVKALAVSPDGERLATAGGHDEGQSPILIREARSGKEILTLTGHVKTVRAVCFSPDGNRLVSTDEEGNLFFWDISPKK